MPHASPEQHRQRHPHARPTERFLESHGVRLAVEHAQVQRQHRQHEEAEANPDQWVSSHDG